MMVKPTTVPSIGLVGISGYARIYLDLIREAQESASLNFRAVVVINWQEEAATVSALRQAGVRVYLSFEEFIKAEAGNIDLCCIPTGIALHAPMAVAALQTGMNVLVEKPLAGSITDADRIIAAEKESRGFVAVGFQDMYMDSVRELKQRLLDGVIGRIEEIRFLGMWPRGKDYYSRNKWAGRLFLDGFPVLDSPLNNAFAHFPNLALYLAGTHLNIPTRIRHIDALLARANPIESFDTAVVKAESEEGVRFWFGATHACCEDSQPIIKILGSRGVIDWNYEDSLSIHYGDSSTESLQMYSAFDARYEMFNKVMKRLSDPEVFIFGPNLARNHTEFIESLHSRFAIIDADPEVLQRHPAGDGNPENRIVSIKGIERLLTAAFIDGSIPDRMKIATTPATAANLVGHRFNP